MFKNLIQFREIFIFLLSFTVSSFLVLTFQFSKYETLQAQVSLSEHLQSEVKVLCLILTCPRNHRTKADHVKKTWGKRCNKLLFVTSSSDPDLETIVVPIDKESEDILSTKTKEGFLHVHDNYLDDYDWFIKADDDSYIIMENLRYLLHQYNSYVALFFGHRFASNWIEEYPHTGYMAGGGYVLSKKAVVKFAKIVRNNKPWKFFANGEPEDVEMGRLLQHSAISVDCRDEKLQKRFFPVGLRELEIPYDKSEWYDQNSYYNVTRRSLDCCSEHSIAFHYILPKEMYLLEYLIYRVQPFGLKRDRNDQKLPQKIKLKDIIAASDAKSFALTYVEYKEIHNMTSSEGQDLLKVLN